MRVLLVLLALGLIAAPAPARAQCPLEAGSVVTELVRVPVSITYNDQLSRRQITNLHGRRISSRYQQVGLTVAKPKYSLYVEGSSIRTPRGLTCAVLTKARITVSVPELTVYINREYRRGTCLYKSVLDHELKHVDIMRVTLERMMERMEVALPKAAAMAGVATAQNGAGALNILKARVQKHMRPLFDAWKAENDRANEALDAKESFVAEASVCP